MNACNTPPTKGKSKLKYQKAKPNSKTKALKIFLNFDLGFNLCALRFALFYYVLPIANYSARSDEVM